MQYRQLGDTGVPISVLTAGNTAPMAGVVGHASREDDAVSAIRAMLDSGVNMIDTASSYAGGESERIVGKALKGVDRSKIVLTSKFGMTFRQENGKRKIVPDISPKNCILECEQSLRRIGTDYIDLYMPHIPDYTIRLEDVLETLEKLQRQAKSDGSVCPTSTGKPCGGRRSSPKSP